MNFLPTPLHPLIVHLPIAMCHRSREIPQVAIV